MTNGAHDDDRLTLKQVQASYGRSYCWWQRRVGVVIPAERYGAGWLLRRGDVEAFLSTLSPKP